MLDIVTKSNVFLLDICPVFWYEQPSNQPLTCDPRGSYLRMKCSILSAESVSLAWFMTNSTDDAGIDGNEIMDGGPFSIVPSITLDNITFASLVFLAEEDTFGYYTGVRLLSLQ